MASFIPHTIGKVYDVAHLRPFDLELAKQGHPLAWFINGCEVRYLAQTYAEDDRWFDFSHYEPSDAAWINRTRSALGVQQSLRLAPLAIKHDPRTGKDEPLHVGDVIEIDAQLGWSAISLSTLEDYFRTLELWAWRWPVEVAQ